MCKEWGSYHLLYYKVRAHPMTPSHSPHNCGGAPISSSAAHDRACAPKRTRPDHPCTTIVSHPTLTFSHHAAWAATLARSSTTTSGVRPTACPFNASTAAVRTAARSTGSAMSAVSWRGEGERVRGQLVRRMPPSSASLLCTPCPSMRLCAPSPLPSPQLQRTRAPRSGTATAVQSPAPPTHNGAPLRRMRHSNSYAADDRKLLVLCRVRAILPVVAEASEAWIGA